MPYIAPNLLISGVLVSALALSFIIYFLIPAIKQHKKINNLLNILQSDELSNVRNPDELSRAFEVDRYLSHLWNEYRKTLYDSIPTNSGVVATEWRSTVSAENFWNGQLVVDSRVHAEFFKHAPGIFTGLGIIGTFIGLIEGLRHFKVSNMSQSGNVSIQASVAQTAQKSLESLMHSVGEAFMISAAAIFLAMLATFLEKYLLNSLYSKVDEIAQLLDEKFASASAEKFLEQTASFTEESATQLKHLKSELLKDLTPLLQELSEKQAIMIERLAQSFKDGSDHNSQKQIDASRDNNIELSNNISNAIKTALEGPLNEIKDAVGQATGDQSTNTIKMLQDVMTSFSQKLNDLFGGQINGINELNQRTAQTMQDAVSKLNELVTSLQDAGKNSAATMAEQMAKALVDMEARQAEITRSTQALVVELKAAIEKSQTTTAEGVKNTSEEMARRMAEAIEKMDQRQESINERTREFVEQLKALVANSQTETNTKLQQTLEALGEQLGQMLGKFQNAQQKVLDDGLERENNTTKKTTDAVNAMTGSVESIIKQMGDASAKMQESLAVLTKVTTSAISGLSEGASEVNSAARNFSNASDKVSEVMGHASSLTSHLSDLTTNVKTTSGVLQQGIQDYSLHRQAVASLVAELNGLVSNAKSDVSITSNVLQRIEQASEKLASAQFETEKFMQGVATVLAKAHEEFRVSVSNSLSKSNVEFHEKLSSAVGLLSSSIKELDDVLATATPNAVKGARA